MKISSVASITLAAVCYGSAFTPSAFSYAPSQWGIQRRSQIVMKQEGAFSLGKLFKGQQGQQPSGLRGSSNLEPHPSVRPHISPLNRLGPDKQKEPKSEPLPIHPDVRSGTLSNGMPYVILPNKSPPGRFEAHLQVFSGSGKFGKQKCAFDRHLAAFSKRDLVYNS
jgi:hypothetical protein